MKKYKALDLFCCGGGASAGLVQAGFEVVGVDIDPQPRYPFTFVQADAMTFDLSGYDFIWASPPCQHYSMATNTQDKSQYPDMIDGVREMLSKQPAPWIIENVETAPLRDPILLCGAMFGLRTYRHRLFESNLPLIAPAHPKHVARVTKMGRPPKKDEFLNPVGHFSGVGLVKEMFGMPWAGQYELAQCIPPVYSKYLGEQVIEWLETQEKENAA